MQLLSSCQREGWELTEWSPCILKEEKIDVDAIRQGDILWKGAELQNWKTFLRSFMDEETQKKKRANLKRQFSRNCA